MGKLQLKPSELLQAHLWSGFTERLENSAVRMTSTGYFEFTKSHFEHKPKESCDVVVTYTGRLDKASLGRILGRLEKLDFEFHKYSPWDDLGSRHLKFRVGDRIRIFNICDSFKKAEFPRKAAFDAAWKLIHKLVEEQAAKCVKSVRPL